MIEARNVHRRYQQGTVSLHVLKGVSLQIADADFVAITGPSGAGAGKSTFLHLLAGLDRPSEGEIVWDGRSLTAMKERELAALRNQGMGFVFQFYHLVPELTAIENVMLPARILGQERGAALKQRAMASLEQVGLGERATHKPRELSGGEMQRVAIARALINRPKVLFCDEPTGNLDSQTGQQVANLLIDVHKRAGMSLVLVTHQHELAQLAGRWLVMRDGALVSETRQPAHAAERAS